MGMVITGKNIDVGSALRTQTEKKLQEICKKYDLNPLDMKVIFSTEGSPYRHLVCCDIEMHIGQGLYLRAQKETDDPHVSLEQALETFETRLRRHKDKVLDHIRKRDVDYVKTPELEE